MEKAKLFYGLDGQKVRKSKFNINFKRKVAQEYLEGYLTTTQLGEKYDICYQRVSEWVKQFSSELAEEQILTSMTEQELKDFELLKKQNEVLKKKLEFEQIKNFALETMVGLAKSELGIDLKKNSGAKQPKE